MHVNKFLCLSETILDYLLQNYHKFMTILINEQSCWKYIVISFILHHIAISTYYGFSANSITSFFAGSR